MRKNKNKPETVDTASVTETEEIKVPKKKKKKTGLIVFLIILILAVAGAAAYYFMERQKPISTTKNYLENVQAMNFDGMKELLQSNDMSALDNADITSAAYTNFFKTINQKMSFEISLPFFCLPYKNLRNCCLPPSVGFCWGYGTRPVPPLLLRRRHESCCFSTARRWCWPSLLDLAFTRV